MLFLKLNVKLSHSMQYNSSALILIEAWRFITFRNNTEGKL